MARKKVNVANIGNLSNDNFYKVKKLCAKAEKLESIIEALQDYKWEYGFITDKDFRIDYDTINSQIEAYEKEYEEVYYQVQKLLKK